MRKLAVFHNLPEGGAHIALYEQVKRLANHHAIDLFSLVSLEGEYSLRPLCKKIFLFPYEVMKKESHGFSRLRRDLASFTVLRKVHREIARQIDGGGYEIAFVHPDRLTQAPYLLRYLQTPSVYYCQEPLRIGYEYELRLREAVGPIKQGYEKLNRLTRKLIDRTKARAATKIICASHYVKEYIAQVYGTKAEVCALGVDTEVFKPLPVMKKGGVLFIGHRARIDGYDLLIGAIAKIPSNQRPRLTVINQTVRGAFKRNQKEMALAYNSAVITICAAVLEPFGLVALESMSCGTPVIAVREWGYRETVLDGKTGFLVERNPGNLAQKIEELIANPEKARRMGVAARAEVEKNWTWDHHIRKLEKILKNPQP